MTTRDCARQLCYARQAVSVSVSYANYPMNHAAHERDYTITVDVLQHSVHFVGRVAFHCECGVLVNRRIRGAAWKVICTSCKRKHVLYSVQIEPKHGQSEAAQLREIPCEVPAHPAVIEAVSAEVRLSVPR